MTTPAHAEMLKIDDYLPYRLSVASNGVSGLIARAYQERFGLTVPQWRLLCVLAQDGPTAEGQIVIRTVMDRITVGSAAAGLIGRALAVRLDGQPEVLSLTDEGGRMYGEIEPLALAYEAALISGLNPEEVKLLKRLLIRLQTAAETLAGEAELPCRLAG